MSVWRRLQRIGKKAAKFQFTSSLQELNIECTRQYTPGTFVVVWSRRSRRYTSKPFECNKCVDGQNAYHHVWSMPENMEFTTTLYRSEKALQFEEKEWVCQIEDVGSCTRGRLSGPSVRRRVLATRQIDLSEFAANLPTQTSLKVVMRLASKKLASANLLLTLHAVIVKEGEATDEDMISLASLMSLSRAGSFNVGSGLTVNDVGGIGGFSPNLPRFGSSRFPQGHSASVRPLRASGDFQSSVNELTARLQALERSPPTDEKLDEEETVLPQLQNGGTLRPGAVDDNSETSATKEVSTVDGTPSKPSILIDTGSSTAIACESKSDNNLDKQSTAASTQSGQELLTWCQEVTAGYANVHVTNLTSSFQSGLAFCAILHHFFPDKLDYASLSPENPKENCRLAFDVAAKLGVPRVLEPGEITSRSRPPDLLSMMTYLHQLRSHCCPGAAAQSGADTPENHQKTLFGQRDNQLPGSDTSPTLNHKPDTQPQQQEDEQQSPNAAEKPPKLRQNHNSAEAAEKRHSALIRYEHMLTKARNLLEQTRLQKHTNMPYTDALPPPGRSKRGRPISFSSGSPLSRSMDDESTSATGHNKANENEFPTTRTKTTMRTHSPQHRFSTNDLSSKKPQHDEHRKSHRRLVRFNSDGTICSPNGGWPHNNVHSPSSPPQPTSTGSQPGRASGQSTPPPTIAPLTPPDGVKIRRLRLSQISLFASGRGSAAPVPTRIGEHRLDAANANAQGQTKISDEPRTPQPTRPQPFDHPVSPSTYRYAMSDQNSPVHRPPVVTTNPALSNYIANEQAELDQAQRELDEEAAQLEQRLRMQMQHAPGTATEEKLLRRWFVLVNKKDALIRRGMQLSIMEKEDDLKKKTEMLQEELRQILSIEDYMKTDSDRRREELLLHDLVQLVNERDDMIQQLDLHEKILADELNLERNASKLPPFETGRSEKACVIQ